MLLKNGSSGVQVKSMQYGLHILCCSPKTFDGSFGDATEAAVKKYQEAYGLTVDGQVGDTTWNSICGEIRPIQKALATKAYYKETVDGVPGEYTYNAIVDFQNKNGLTPDGQVGPTTRQKLMRVGATEVGDSDFPLKEGDFGDKVVYLQYGLRILCCAPGLIDGNFGSFTTVAVKKFQTKYSLTVDGVVGSATWKKMEALISEIQQALVNKGYSIGAVDGIAGPGTYEAVKEFQSANGMTSDGQIGPLTRQKLMDSSTDTSTDAFPLKEGSSGPYVLYLQYGLRILCINPNGLDGKFGSGTTTAVKKFQTNNSLTSDGIVGTTTWEKLRTLIRPIQQALANAGYYTGIVDGIAGDETYNAVLLYQGDNGLTADGMVGTSTKQKLGITTSGGGSGTTSSVLKLGSNGSLVRYLQRVLNILGYTNSVDGVFGESTENAVKEFQASTYVLAADGVVGSGTWVKIFERYTVDVTGVGAQRFANVAVFELAMQFKEDNSNNITPYGEWYGMNGAEWCAMFVSWCAKQAGILGTKVPKYAYCPSGVEWYRNKGKFKTRSGGYTPRIGDTVFFWSTSKGRVGHTGIVVEVTDTTVTTIEGNTNDGVGRHVYNKTNTYIHGYGCNDGPVSSTISPTAEEIKDALTKKIVSILRASNTSVNYDNTSGTYKIPCSKNGEIELTVNKEFEYYIAPYIKVSVEAATGSKLYDSFDSDLTFKIENGEAKAGNLKINDEIGMVTTPIGEIERFNNIIDGICLSVDDGVGKFECEVTIEHMKYSYALEAELPVDEHSNLTYSVVYSLTFEYPNGDTFWEPAYNNVHNSLIENENWSDAKVTIMIIALIIILVGGIYAPEMLCLAVFCVA